VEEQYGVSHMDFLRENGIAHFRVIVQANKNPEEKTPDHVINGILEILLNKTNHPILIHCNKGKVGENSLHHDGCFNWSSAAPYWLCGSLFSKDPGLELA
jgi:hypothetical protein